MTETKKTAPKGAKRTAKTNQGAEIVVHDNQLELPVEAIEAIEVVETTEAEATETTETVEVENTEGDEKKENKKSRNRKPKEPRGEVKDTRDVIRKDLKDLDMDEVRAAVKRCDKTRVVSVILDRRNAQAFDKVVDLNGINRTYMSDLAVSRFLADVVTNAEEFPYRALEDIQLLVEDKSTIIISEGVYDKLVEFCKRTKQQRQLVINLAVQCLCDQLKATIK